MTSTNKTPPKRLPNEPPWAHLEECQHLLAIANKDKNVPPFQDLPASQCGAFEPPALAVPLPWIHKIRPQPLSHGRHHHPLHRRSYHYDIKSVGKVMLLSLKLLWFFEKKIKIW